MSILVSRFSLSLHLLRDTDGRALLNKAEPNDSYQILPNDLGLQTCRSLLR